MLNPLVVLMNLRMMLAHVQVGALETHKRIAEKLPHYK